MVAPTFPLVGLSVIEGLTVKEAEPVPAPTVIATFFDPTVWVGTVKVVPENDPVESVVFVPLTVTVEPPKVAEIEEEAGKPKPETVTVEPTIPFEGFRAIDGFTVKVADTELTVSETLTVWLPYTEMGILNVAENDPVPEARIVAGVVN